MANKRQAKNKAKLTSVSIRFLPSEYALIVKAVAQNKGAQVYEDSFQKFARVYLSRAAQQVLDASSMPHVSDRSPKL